MTGFFRDPIFAKQDLDQFFCNRGAHGDNLDNISPLGESSQEAPTSTAA